MESKTPSPDDNRAEQRTSRKPYTKPELRQYGNLAEITKTVAGSKALDGSNNPNKHWTS